LRVGSYIVLHEGQPANAVLQRIHSCSVSQVRGLVIGNLSLFNRFMERLIVSISQGSTTNRLSESLLIPARWLL
jgi:hypothetical protein